MKSTSTQITSVIFSKFQTTIPKGVRQILGLKEGDKILYTPHEDGILITKLEKGHHTCPCCQGTGLVKEKED